MHHETEDRYTLYAHLNIINPMLTVLALTIGSNRVPQGFVIGFGGNTGDSTGPHLHFEIRKFEQPDPLYPQSPQELRDNYENPTKIIDTLRTSGGGYHINEAYNITEENGLALVYSKCPLCGQTTQDPCCAAYYQRMEAI